MIRTLVKTVVGVSCIAFANHASKRDSVVMFLGEPIREDTKEVLGALALVTGVVMVANSVGTLIR